ncbi:unnamed protein product [marine sediment metagenome]|uniref:Uncharacterized protein n=1 Tax=marine sediment metagenome TaxID=412755 RepID=X0SD82_9ZZZZ
MLQAMIHGKLTREEEGLEDLLTSNTFGLMKYLPPKAVLLPFLSLAKDPLRKHSLASWLQGAIKIERLLFWPTLTHTDCFSCEPDVAIVFLHDDGTKTWVLIEAKYRSGKSSEAIVGIEKPNDQLAREFDNLKNISQHKGIMHYALVYLTTDYICPKNELEESANEYKQKRDSSPNLYWLSWRMLYDVLELSDYSENSIIEDLKNFMLNLNLTMFRRLRFEDLKKPEWSFERIPKYWSWSILKPNWIFMRKELSWNWFPFPKPEKWYFLK